MARERPEDVAILVETGLRPRAGDALARAMAQDGFGAEAVLRRPDDDGRSALGRDARRGRRRLGAHPRIASAGMVAWARVTQLLVRGHVAELAGVRVCAL